MVERVSHSGSTTGQAFWGCTDFPRCRGTRPVERAAPEPTPKPNPGSAGASAQAEYDRRHERHRAKVRARRPRTLVLGGAVIVVGLALWASGQAIGPIVPLYGAIVALAAAAWVLSALFEVPSHVLAWQRGAIGEEETANALAKLPSSFVVLHDRRIPRSNANIDHIVIGPPGVFVVETKRYSGRLTVRGDDVFVAGRRRSEIVEQVRREADVVASVLRAAGEAGEVTPILCIHRAELPWRAARVGGVAIVSGRGLVAMLSKATEVLSTEEIARLGTMLDSALANA